MAQNFRNPYQPGAGHPPPYLAGREDQKADFIELLKQERILDNVVLTGLRGTGKTVLLATFHEMAIGEKWLWAGSDLSEDSASKTDEKLALRLMTDLAILTSQIVIHEEIKLQIGFGTQEKTERTTLDFSLLQKTYKNTPGLVADKLKAVLEKSWLVVSKQEESPRGIIFAYDEAQNLSDNAAKDEHPLSLLLEVFQSLQKKGLPLMLVLTGLPTVFPKLVEARTYAERMFKIIELIALDETASRDAIVKPLEQQQCPVRFNDTSIQSIIQTSGGYPYFIQFICREVYNIWIEDVDVSVSMDAITGKLDRDFFAGRWDKATDRQRDLMRLISRLRTADEEFTVQQIVEVSKDSDIKSFSGSHVTQSLGSLIEKGLVYKNRHGRYMFAVPLLALFIKRSERSL